MPLMRQGAWGAECAASLLPSVAAFTICRGMRWISAGVIKLVRENEFLELSL